MNKTIKKIIFISIDNLRYDCIGFQPDKSELIKHDVLKYLETPTLDSLAERSLCFTQCISTNTYTTASHASILTGLCPPRHGVRAFYDTKLSNDVTTLAEILRRNGYRTILHTDSPVLFVPPGLSRGFEFVLTRDDGKLIRLLEDLKEYKVFLLAHVMDVHEPYLHNTNEFCSGVNNDYLDEIYNLYRDYKLLDLFDRNGISIKLWDRLMRGPLSNRPIDVLLPLYVRGVTKFDKGRFNCLIKNLGNKDIMSNALMAVFSDHGEGRCYNGDKEYFNHAGALYDNVLRIPFMITCPDIKPGVNDKLMSSVDILPTILSILDINDTEERDGLDILSEKRGMCYAEFWEAYGDFYLASDDAIKPIDGQWPEESMMRQMAVRTDSYKFVKNNKYSIEEFLSKDVLWHSNKEYIEQLYKCILGRYPDRNGLEHHLKLLNSGTKTKNELLQDFFISEENKAMPKYHLYDLLSDKEEDFPIDASRNLESKIFFDRIAELNSQAVITGKIFEKETPETPEPIAAASGADDKSFIFKSLGEKESKSIEVIRKAAEIYGIEHVGVAWTGGKDSTTVLHLTIQAFGGHIPFKVINIDTSAKFPEVYAFRDRLNKDWGLDLRIFRNEYASGWLKESKDHAECCYQLKTIPLNHAIEALGLRALLTGVRWDEQEARTGEKYFSPREEPGHIRVQPILHFREVDIWHYIKKYNIPYCELYNKGYRSLGCAPCTGLSSGKHERSGRAQEKEAIMAKLRELGYF